MLGCGAAGAGRVRGQGVSGGGGGAQGADRVPHAVWGVLDGGWRRLVGEGWRMAGCGAGA